MSTEITRTETTDNSLPVVVWTLTVDGETIGTLMAHTSGLILSIDVEAEHRGEGHARRLYRDADMPLLHVPAWGRTEEGHGFAEAVGGDVMDDQDACDILGLDLAVVTGTDLD